eukprot:1464869-Rhodomonas_salina.1
MGHGTDLQFAHVTGHACVNIRELSTGCGGERMHRLRATCIRSLSTAEQYAPYAMPVPHVAYAALHTAQQHTSLSQYCTHTAAYAGSVPHTA